MDKARALGRAAGPKKPQRSPRKALSAEARGARQPQLGTLAGFGGPCPDGSGCDSGVGMIILQSAHSSLGMGKSPGRFGAPRGPCQPWERFPGSRCYFRRVKQEGEGCRGKFNVPPAGPAPIQAGMKTIRGERAAEPPAVGPDPTGTGGTRGTRTGARRSPRGQDGVSRLGAAPPPPSRPLP